jgi:hypothetical protein
VCRGGPCIGRRICGFYPLDFRLSVRVLRRIFGPKRDEVAGENCVRKSFMISTLRQL